jgi:type II secretory pathway component PulC
VNIIFGVATALAVWALGLSGAGPQQLPQPAPPASTLPLQLAAVVLDKESPAKSSCLIRCTYPTEKQGRFVAGQTACDLAEIKEIRQQEVLINNLLRSRLEVLLLAHGQRGAAAPPPAVPVPAPDPALPVVTESPDGISVELAKDSVEHYLGNLPDVLASALAAPRLRDGPNGAKSVDGYEIGSVKEAGTVEQLGLRNGDVILEVNGQPLDGLPTILRLLGQIQTLPQVKLTVLRKGQKVTVVFNTKGPS